MYSIHLLKFRKGKKKNVNCREEGPVAEFEDFRVRECHFSVKIRAIRPSAVFGTRRRTALCGEGFAWVLDL